MPKIFISYSSKDQNFVRNLAADLYDLGNLIWLDEWEIKVGECIVTKVEHGITEADYVVLVLSPNSVISNWVEREWKAKYWDEVERGQIFILPILIEDCEIPSLIKTKKYADFRKSYSVGLVQLAGGINPVIQRNSNLKELENYSNKFESDISALIAKLQSKIIPVSQCFAEALVIAQKVENPSLVRFCREELSGLEQGVDREPNGRHSYRVIEGFVSIDQINMQYGGWGEGITNILAFMRNSDSFHSWKVLIPFSISKIENQQPENPRKQLMIMEMSSKQIIPDSSLPEQSMFLYFDSYSLVGLLESIRTELTRKLLALLPEVEI